MFSHLGQPYPFDIYPQTSMPGSPVEVSTANYEQMVRTMGGRSALVSGAIEARSLALSQIHFKFRSLRDQSRYFGTEALAPLEKPGPSTTRWNLLSKVEPDIAHHGNFYLRRLSDGRLKRLRPDWVALLIGSNERPNRDEAPLAADAELIGYLYKPGGMHSEYTAQMLAPSEVAHWAPSPHPLHHFIGEAWLSKVWREVASDMQATDHASKFFENAATANMIVSTPPDVTNTTQFNEWVDAYEEAHAGSRNAWKTVYVQAGTDVTVVGAKMAELAMEELQGGFETRVSMASRVPATVALMREGNKGSALNGTNYSQIRRMWADAWFQSYAQGFCASLENIINVPGGSELTYDPERILLLQEDQLDAAQIQSTQAQVIRTLVDGGYSPDAAVSFVRNNGNLAELLGNHTGKLSVQLQNADGTDDEESAKRAREIAEIVQKIYLGVTNGVLTAEEARSIINDAGAQLGGSTP